MMVGRLRSFWDGVFSGAMLNFQGVCFSTFIRVSRVSSISQGFPKQIASISGSKGPPSTQAEIPYQGRQGPTNLMGKFLAMILGRKKYP